MQHNDDPELWADLKRKEVEYEKRRNKKVQYFESVKHAQTVQVDEIPLPQMSVPSDGAGVGVGLIDTAVAPPNLFVGAPPNAASQRIPLPLHAHNHISLPPPALLGAPPPLGYAKQGTNTFKILLT